MRKIESEMCNAIKSVYITGKAWQKNNTKVLQLDNKLIEVRLFNNLIAIIAYDDFIILKDANHRTVTTKSRLNALLQHFNILFQIYQKDYQWYVFRYKAAPDFPWTGELCLVLSKKINNG